jgi:hypothetical protein
MKSYLNKFMIRAVENLRENGLIGPVLGHIVRGDLFCTLYPGSCSLELIEISEKEVYSEPMRAFLLTLVLIS